MADPGSRFKLVCSLDAGHIFEDPDSMPRDYSRSITDR